MTKEQIALAVITIVLVPLTVSVFRRLRAIEEQAARTESFLNFLQTYLLKGAVLEFRSNPNPNDETDKIIDKINAGESVSPEEMRQLKEKIQKTAVNGTADPKKQMNAQRTIELMDQIFEWQESVKRQSRKRNDLFNE